MNKSRWPNRKQFYIICLSLIYIEVLGLFISLVFLAFPVYADGWTIEYVDQSRTFDMMTDRSLALDGTGRPHVAYGGHQLNYAYYDGTSWHTEVADDSSYVGRYASLALDTSSRPHISYYDAVYIHTALSLEEPIISEDGKLLEIARKYGIKSYTLKNFYNLTLPF